MLQAQISTSRASFGDQTREDGLSTTTRNSQHRSESSCSNSLSAPFTKVPETSKEAYSPCNTEEKNIVSVTVGKSSVCSDISDGFNCTSKTVENIRSCEEHDNHPTRSGDIEIIKREISGEAEYLAEFDLNEDILNVDGSDDFFQPVIENVTSRGVLRVVVKIGVPSGWPVFPLEFAGRLGWKGPSKPSAFRPFAISKNSNIKMCYFTGIDLNVAAVEDSAAVNGIMLAGPCSNPREGIDLKMAESPNFDLNRLYDAVGDDDFTPGISHSLDLNLNMNTKKTIDPMRSGNRDFNPISSDYLHSLSTMPPKFPFLSHALPPQSYPSKDRLHVGLVNPCMVKTPFGNNHLGQVFHEQVGNVKMGQSRQYMFLANNSSMGDRLQQDNWFRTSNKRKETEGGLEFYQHG